MTRRPIALVALLLIGCGTVTMELTTSIRGPDDIRHNIAITATGAMANLMQSTFDADEMQRLGWDEVNLTREGENLTIQASGVFTLEEIQLARDQEGSGLDGFIVTIDETDEKTVYRVSIELESDTSDQSEPEEELDEAMKAMLTGTMLILWELEMPGTITDSNADTVDGATASWVVDLVTYDGGLFS